MPFSNSCLEGLADASGVAGKSSVAPACFEDGDGGSPALGVHFDGDRYGGVEFREASQFGLASRREYRADIAAPGLAAPGVKARGQRAAREANERRVGAGAAAGRLKPLGVREHRRGMARMLESGGPQLNNNAHGAFALVEIDRTNIEHSNDLSTTFVCGGRCAALRGEGLWFKERRRRGARPVWPSSRDRRREPPR